MLFLDLVIKTTNHFWNMLFYFEVRAFLTSLGTHTNVNNHCCFYIMKSDSVCFLLIWGFFFLLPNPTLHSVVISNTMGPGE